jgi:hypothetical protein
MRIKLFTLGIIVIFLVGCTNNIITGGLVIVEEYI